ncbi:MAG TPA: MBL fold metallo-hydrolase [Solirubrobacteraceae bacterium]|nr:MBL fold metallo-hydrolase [Solirubrobacteraceae bacterium]
MAQRDNPQAPQTTAEFAALETEEFEAEERAAREKPQAGAQGAAGDDAGAVARGYFGALERGERTAQREWYHDEAGDLTMYGTWGPSGKGEAVAWFDDLYAAFPDFRLEVLDLITEGDRAVVRWRARGTFAGPGRFQGFAPNGAAVSVEGMDVLWAHEGRVGRLVSYTDNATIARQLGAMPPQGSPAEAGLTRALNARTTVAGRLGGSTEPEEIAAGVWRVQGGFPGDCNVYLLRDGAGLTMFDAGGRYMTAQVRAAAARLGGIERIVLSHGHPDHRGTAPAFDIPTLCHPDEVADAEGTGGWRYWQLDKLPAIHRIAHTRVLHPRFWDGGPARITETVVEGDTVAGFEVIHLPGHAPGLIALWRAEDRLALVSDAFFTLDLWGRAREPALPFEAYNLDTELARASLRKLAALEPAAAWPGHAEPVRGDVREALERAAAG